MLLRSDSLPLAEFQCHRRPSGDGAPDLHAAAMANLEMAGRKAGEFNSGRFAPGAQAAPTMDRDLLANVLCPTAAGELHSRSHAIGGRSSGKSPPEIGSPGTGLIGSRAQSSPGYVKQPLRNSSQPPRAFSTNQGQRQIVGSDVSEQTPTE